jgi:hypothetical protein
MVNITSDTYDTAKQDITTTVARIVTRVRAGFPHIGGYSVDQEMAIFRAALADAEMVSLFRDDICRTAMMVGFVERIVEDVAP